MSVGLALRIGGTRLYYYRQELGLLRKEVTCPRSGSSLVTWLPQGTIWEGRDSPVSQ